MDSEPALSPYSFLTVEIYSVQSRLTACMPLICGYALAHRDSLLMS
jgi:hypothetical protein